MTILSFFLVDPDISDESGDSDNTLPPSVPAILTTSCVPPQQKTWTKQALEESLDPRIPNEIVERIMDFVEGTLSEDEAAEIARQMRTERDWFRISHARFYFNLPFDIWTGEHGA